VRYARTVLSLVLERLSGAAGRGAGSFAGGLLNNPAVVIIGALALVFVFFGGDIRKAFGDFGKNIGKVELPDINLPAINFPDIKFPDFDFKFPDFDFKFPDFDFKLPDFSNIFGQAGEDLGETLGGAGEAVSGGIESIGKGISGDLDAIIKGIFGGDTEPPLSQVLPPSTGSGGISAMASAILTPRAEREQMDLSIPVAPSIAESIIAPFQGGGVSFEGGQIFETPTEFLSLGQIIDKFDVTASQAADIRAQAIGFTPEEQEFLNLGQEVSPLGDIASAPQVSDPMFEGLTPEEIALRLTGGNISNF